MKNIEWMHLVIGSALIAFSYVEAGLTPLAAYGKELDLLFIVDSSESIAEHDPFGQPGFYWMKLKEFMSECVALLPIATGHTHVAILTYSNVPRARFGFGSYIRQPEEMRTHIMNMVAERGYTDTAGALAHAAQHMFQGERDDARKVVIFITDGLSNEGRHNVRFQAENLKLLRLAEIYTIAITPYVDWPELKAIATTENHALMVDLKENVETAVRSIISNIWDASAQPPTLPSFPCEIRTDLVLIADNSGSIQIDNFPVLQQFLVSLIDSLIIGPDFSQVALIRFSEFAHVEFYLDEFETQREVHDAIWNMRYDGDATNIAAGIQLARTVFDTNRGDREMVRNIAIVITDGQSNIDSHQVQLEADAAKEEGVSFFVVGITDQIDERELHGISSLPLSDHFFNSTDLSHLETIRDKLTRMVCYSNIETFSDVALENGGYSIPSNRRR